MEQGCRLEQGYRLEEAESCTRRLRTFRRWRERKQFRAKNLQPQRRAAAFHALTRAPPGRVAGRELPPGRGLGNPCGLDL